MSRRVELPALPHLGTLYARAAAGSARALAGRQVKGLFGHAGGLAKQAEGGALVLPDTVLGVADFQTDGARLSAYQRLMGAPLRDTLPSVFVHGTVFPLALGVMSQDGFPLPLLGMVHLENAVEHHRPVGARERLAAAAWAEKLRPHHAGTQVDVVCEVSAGGATVWRGTSTYLAKGVWDGPRPERQDRSEWNPPQRTAAWRLGTAAGRDYARVLGDYNPIHLGALPAKTLGLKRHIAHGMYLAGRSLAALAPHDAGYAWRIGFQAPVFLPAAVDFRAETHDDGGADFCGWNPRSGARHFHGEVRRS